MGDNYLKYGVCTNYGHFILLTKDAMLKKCHFFDFLTIKDNPDKLKEFIGIFSKSRLVDTKFVDDLAEASITEDQVFTKEFYKLYHETRLMMIMAFEENDNVSRKTSVYITQLFLNRLIFIFFAQDRKFVDNNHLFSDRVLNILESSTCTEHTNKICQEIKDLFSAFDKGSDILKISEFNGGLFTSSRLPENISFSDLKNADFFTKVKQHSQLSKIAKLNEKAAQIVNNTPNLNPIISNLLIMDSYDFNTEVNVNILGHIFEQSIVDLEFIEKQGISQKKVEGVYYTPENITEYICKNTIIPYLSKSDVTTIPELIEEYREDIEGLEKKLEEIRILDPACGSGAFLIKAIDILIEIHEELYAYNTKNEGDQLLITKEWDEDSKIRAVVENNIFGVDINSKSIEITQLSIFLKIASKTRKLSGLSERIQDGNSLIQDNTIAPNAFVWGDRFAEVLGPIRDRGFNCIIGNPPWQIVKPNIREFFGPIYDEQDHDQKFSRLNAIERKNFMDKILEQKQIKIEYNQYIENYKKQMRFFNGDSYKHQTSVVNGKNQSSDHNLYKLFIEKSYTLLSENGMCGLIIPSGIYSDLGTKGLRELLFENTQIKSLFSFINRKGIFEDVHKQFKFCTLVFSKGNSTDKFLASFYNEDASQLETFDKIAFTFDVDFIKYSSPDSLSILECSNNQELDILKKLYVFPLLRSDKWDFKASAEFHMTQNSNLFHTANIGLPLYEGKMMNSFNHTFSEPRYWIEEKEGGGVLTSKELFRMKKINKKHTIIPRIDSDEYRLVWRSITNSTNTRTLISTILPKKVFLGNSLNYLNPLTFDGSKYVEKSLDETLFICGIFNSFVIDFIVRHKVATNMNIFYLMELPIPRYNKNNLIHNKVFENTAKLICTTNEFAELRESVGIPDYATDPDRRLALESQINAYAAKIYGLTRDELEYVLNTFPSEKLKKLKELTLDEFSILESK